MAKKTVCDVCEETIPDGENAAQRNPMFVLGQVQVTATVRIEGKTNPDLCLACLKKVVAEA